MQLLVLPSNYFVHTETVGSPTTDTPIWKQEKNVLKIIYDVHTIKFFNNW
jgi:hypothetical protein